ncbi:MAG: class I SAM-dependent methyltransferase [Ferrimicrobium sp.]
MDIETLNNRVAEIQWCHSIDLGNGIITPGLSKTRPIPDDQFPVLYGKSVLDIGAWDGLNSFMAEQKGASRVVALDHYAWGVDMARRNDYWDQCRSHHSFPDYREDETTFWNPELPGKAGFNLAHEVLNSRVEPLLGDFMKKEPAEIGTFDVVLFLGVLYHLREPLTALERVRALTNEVAVIETSAISLPGLEEESLIGYYAGDELDRDFGNYFGVTAKALSGMLRSVGFSRTKIVAGVPKESQRRFAPKKAKVYRLIMHAYA